MDLNNILSKKILCEHNDFVLEEHLNEFIIRQVDDTKEDEDLFFACYPKPADVKKILNTYSSLVGPLTFIVQCVIDDQITTFKFPDKISQMEFVKEMEGFNINVIYTV